KDEARAVQARLAKLDFRVKLRPFAGRKGKSDRVVLVELFTGAQSKECVASLRAAEALEKTFKPADVLVLRYHLGLDAPDPPAGLESEERVGFYRQRELPAAIFDGRASLGCEGEAEAAQETYENCLEAILPRLDAPSGAKLSLEAT